MQKLSDADLTSLLDDMESDRVERKASFKGDVSTKARQAVCAFANDLPNHQMPGVLFIGASDDGTPSGEPIDDRLLQSLSDMRSDGRIWIRTGPRRATANAQEERVLNERRRYKNLPFDLYPVPTATLGDLSKNLFENEFLPGAFAEDVLLENGRSYEERLASCRMIQSAHEPIPTITGLLALGKSPQDILPGAYIQFLRIDGTELTDPVVDEAMIGGAMADMLRRAEEKLQSHNRTTMDITSQATHRSHRPYPPVALQQILYNAVLHRTYEGTNAPVRVYWFRDRIEIHSPGGPYGNVTAENFARPGITDYRNPNIVTVLKTFGFVQAFGRGIALARKAMQENGNPELEFSVNISAVQCTLREAA